jgi:hypothetical protein
MYFEYTSRQTVTVERNFKCACGFKSIVKVIGVGKGSANTRYGRDEDRASGDAEEYAYKAAMRNADLTVRLCPCPRCGKREGIREFMILWGLALVGLVALGWIVGAIIASDHNGRGLWVFGGLSFVFVIIYYFTSVHWKWATAQGRVMFYTQSTRRP